MAPVARPSAPPCAAGARIACWGLAAANADPWRCRSGVRQPYFSSSCPLESAPSLMAQVILPAAPLQSLAAMCSLPLSQRLPRINLNLRAAAAGNRRTTRPTQSHKGRPEPSVDVPGTLNLNRDDTGPNQGPDLRLILRLPARRTRQEKLDGDSQSARRWFDGSRFRVANLPRYRVRCGRWLPPGTG